MRSSFLKNEFREWNSVQVLGQELQVSLEFPPSLLKTNFWFFNNLRNFQEYHNFVFFFLPTFIYFLKNDLKREYFGPPLVRYTIWIVLDSVEIFKILSKT